MGLITKDGKYLKIKEVSMRETELYVFASKEARDEIEDDNFTAIPTEKIQMELDVSVLPNASFSLADNLKIIAYEKMKSLTLFKKTTVDVPFKPYDGAIDA